MKIICKDRKQKSKPAAPEARGVSSVSADVDRLLGPKSYAELEKLEKQIRAKLKSNEPIDVDYWEHLLRSLIVWKARAKLRGVSETILKSRLDKLRKQQEDEALAVRGKLGTILGNSKRQHRSSGDADTTSPIPPASAPDPEPILKLCLEDKRLDSISEKEFLQNIVSSQCIIAFRYIH